MSTKPRNPRYFPKMKVRGARRRLIAPFQRMAGSFDRLGEAFRDVGRLAEEATRAFKAAFPPAPTTQLETDGRTVYVVRDTEAGDA
jgi:hypothetical protein